MSSPPVEEPLAGESLAARAVRRRTGERVDAAEAEVRRLLDVGLELMREDPARSPRIADIVRRAKVSNDAFYRAFRGKDDLMAAIADDGARRLLGHVRHQLDKHTDPVEQVRAFVHAVVKQAADPGISASTRAVLRHVGRGGTGSAGGVALRNGLAEVLAEPLAAAGSADPPRDALVGACAVLAVMEYWLWAERAPEPADVEHLIARVLPAQ